MTKRYNQDEIKEICKSLSLPFDKWAEIANSLDVLKILKEDSGTPINESFDKFVRKNDISTVMSILAKYHQNLELHESTPKTLVHEINSIKKEIPYLIENWDELNNELEFKLGCDKCLETEKTLDDYISGSKRIVKHSQAIGNNDFYRNYTRITPRKERTRHQEELMCSLGIKELDEKLNSGYQ